MTVESPSKKTAVRTSLQISARRMFWGVMTAGGLVRITNGMGAIAYPWTALELAGPSLAGLIAFAVLAPMALGGMFGGTLVERYGVRSVAVTSTLLSAVSMGAIAALAIAGHLSATGFVLLVLAGSVLDGPGLTANQARWPEIAKLARMPLIRANALDAAVDHVVILIAPSAASLAIWIWGWQAALTLMALVGFCACIVTGAAMPRFRLHVGSAAPVAAVAEGMRFLWRTRLLRILLTLGLAGTAVFVAIESVVVPSLVKVDGQSSAVLSLYLIASGVGALTGAGLTMRFGVLPGLNKMLALAFVVMASSVCMLAVSRSPCIMVASGALFGLAFGPLGPVIDTLFQTLPPKRLRAQVIALSLSVELAGAPLAAVAAGYGLEFFTGDTILTIGASLLAALALISFFSPGLRERPQN